MQDLSSYFNKEREITSEIGKGLEDSLKEAKKIDYQIARTLSNNNLFSKVPIIRNLLINIKAIKPLGSLEGELRTSLNNSLTSLARVGKKTCKEKERIHQLKEIYKCASQDEWKLKEFMQFIEANTDINYNINIDGEEMDMKEIFFAVDSQLSEEKREEKQKEYLDWFGQHINLSEQYLESMYALCLVGCEWISGMTRSYFDLTQLRSGMEEIQKTLKNLKSGGISSLTTQKAIREYGTAYINGMRNLVKGYRRMCALKDGGSDQFRNSIKKLQEELNTPASQKLENYNTENRLIYNPNKKVEKD